MTRRIYFDFNATTPLAPEVEAAMRHSLANDFGNPSSQHWAGAPARDAVEAARSQVAALLCCDARRAGTENVTAIVGLGASCELAVHRLEEGVDSLLRDYFWQRLQQVFGGRVELNGHLTERLPNTLNVSFRRRVGSDLLARLPHLAASTGSACHAGDACISPVLEAMGVPVDLALGAIRFSLGRTSTVAEVDEAVERLQSVAGHSEQTAGAKEHRGEALAKR